MTNTTGIVSLGFTALIVVVAIVGATVAVCLDHIDASTYAAIVAGFAGMGTGAGVHANGVRGGAGISNGNSNGGSN